MEDDLYFQPADGTYTTYYEGDEDDENSEWYMNPPKVYGTPVPMLNGLVDELNPEWYQDSGPLFVEREWWHNKDSKPVKKRKKKAG